MLNSFSIIIQKGFMNDFTVDGHNAERENISIDVIDYDPNNPRIQRMFDQGNREKNEATIKLALGGEDPDEDSS